MQGWLRVYAGTEGRELGEAAAGTGWSVLVGGHVAILHSRVRAGRYAKWYYGKVWLIPCWLLCSEITKHPSEFFSDAVV